METERAEQTELVTSDPTATLTCISVRLGTLQGSEVAMAPWCPPPAAPLAPFSQVTSAPGASFVRSPLLPAGCKKTLIGRSLH